MTITDLPQIIQKYRTLLPAKPPLDRLGRAWLRPGWPRHLLAGGLIIIWLAVIFGLPAVVEIQLASWLTFIALLVAPGYFLADIITWRLNLDTLERLALAFPCSVALLALPGSIALLLHLTIIELTLGWLVVAALVISTWIFHGLGLRLRARLTRSAQRLAPAPWTLDEIILALLIAAAFLYIMPLLTQPKIDGDAYAVNAFVADALAGLPLNATEPIFGTDLGPGVRMVFNQSLPMAYLWSYLGHFDANTLTAVASRPMLALWIILASYTLGKAAGGGSRRFGLWVAALQLLIYIAAPFLRGDNVSLFFFERTSADKFMVPTMMLPVVFALAMRYLREGRPATWWAAAVVTIAVSAIHPLIAAMQALALTAFGGLHLLLNLRQRSSWWRVSSLAGLVFLVMLLPLVQLTLSRSEAPLAPSYPRSFEGWPTGQKLTSVLPFVELPVIDLHGPLPALSQLDAVQADSPTNPFLIWRFAVNMERQRLLMFDLDRYISDPNLLMEPPYLLALLLLPLLLWRLRASLAAQFALSVSLAMLLVMFNPLLTPLIGSLVMPWILWRFVWLLPYALIIVLALARLAGGVEMVMTWLLKRRMRPARFDRLARYFVAYAPLTLVILGGLLLTPLVSRNLHDLRTRSGAPVAYPVPERLLTHLDNVTRREGPAMVLADPLLSVTLPAYVAQAGVVAHRVPTTSEVFPANQQRTALQRLIDQETFFRAAHLTPETVEILRRYDVGYVIVPGGSDMDAQLRLAPVWFEWVGDDLSYSLYAVKSLPTETASLSRPQSHLLRHFLRSQDTASIQAQDTASIQAHSSVHSLRGNAALAAHQWSEAAQHYQEALAAQPDDALAQLGLADIAQAQGRFDEALTRLQSLAVQHNQPVLRYRLGQLYAALGQSEQSLIEFEQAQLGGPAIDRYHIALGHACLQLGRQPCAAEQYRATVANQPWPDDASRLIAQADLWQQQGRSGRAISLYEEAVAVNPSLFNHLVLERAYRDSNLLDSAVHLSRDLRGQHPLTPDVTTTLAEALAAQGDVEQATRLYQEAVLLQELQAAPTTDTRLGLARMLLSSGRLAEAGPVIDGVLAVEPYNALAYRLQGELLSQQQQPQAAIDAYTLSFQLDPGQLATYTALSNQLRLQGQQAEVAPAVLQTALQANPDEPLLHLAAGDQWQRFGDLPAAIDAYQAGLATLDGLDTLAQPRRRATTQNRAVIYSRLAQVYEDSGQMEAALNYYRAATATAPGLPWPNLLLGDALWRQNDLAGAEGAYRRVVQNAPDYVEGYLRLADLLCAKGNVGEADSLYDQALRLAQAQVEQRPYQAETLSPPGPETTPTLESGETLLGGATYPVGQANAVPPFVATDGPDSNQAVEAARVLARIYQLNGQPGQVIELYEQQLEQGQRESWPPATLAQYHKSLADLYVVQGRPTLAQPAYEQALALNGGWTEARLGLAQALSAQGNLAAATTHLRQAVAATPGAVEAHLALADTLEQAGQPEEALAIYEATAAAYPGRTQTTLALALAQRSRDRWALAEELYGQALAMTPGQPEIYVDLAELLIDQRRYEEAEQLLQQGLSVDQQDLNLHLRLAEVAERQANFEQALARYRRTAALPLTGQPPSVTLIDALTRYGDYDTARTYLDQTLQRQPEQSELRLRLARLQRTQGQFPAAAATLSEALERSPTNDRLWAEQAALHQAQGQTEAAITAYRQALSLQPEEAGHYLALSQLLEQQGRFEEAQALLTEGQAVTQAADLYIAGANLRLRRNEPEAALAVLEAGMEAVGVNGTLLVAMGSYYMGRGDFEQVERRYSEALELRPEAAAVYTAWADLALRQGETALALERYQQAITFDPTNPRHALALANAYRLSDQPQAAIDRYNQVLAAAPTLVEAYVNLAALYEAQEQPTEARTIYERGLAVAPTAERLLAPYSALLLEQGEAESALALLDQALAERPTAALLRARAALYSQLERFAEAAPDLQAARQAAPGEAESLLALGDLARVQDDLAQAEQFYREASALQPGLPTPYLRLSDLAILRGDIDAARDWTLQARDLEPGSLLGVGGE